MNWPKLPAKLFWSARSVPELAGLPEAEFRAAYEACVTPIWKRRIGTAVLVGLPLLMGGQLIGGLINSSWGPVLGAAIGGLITAQIYIQIVLNAARPSLRNFINDKDLTDAGEQ